MEIVSQMPFSYRAIICKVVGFKVTACQSFVWLYFELPVIFPKFNKYFYVFQREAFGILSFLEILTSTKITNGL